MGKAKAYTKAGVDIDLADGIKKGLKSQLKKATRPEVLGSIGGFGGLFDLSKSKFKNPVLVSSTDGVGTKLKIAFASGQHKGIGEDIVNHCLNDIAVVGAEPLYFLDYFGAGKLDAKVFHQVLTGMAKACTAAKCALIGGETAQMAGFYKDDEYDIVGTIVGIAEKNKLLSGAPTKPGDVIIGIGSNGLHTNGYSLARNLFFKKMRLKVNDPFPGEKRSVASVLLKSHLNYANLIQSLLTKFNKGSNYSKRNGNKIFGIAHITGGGFTGNIPRILPDNCDAVINTKSWPLTNVFKVISERGKISFEELYEVFNMGIGLTLTVSKDQADEIFKHAKILKHKAYLIGNIVKGSNKVKLIP